MLSGRLGLVPSQFFITPVRPGLRDHPLKFLQGQRLRRTSQFSKRTLRFKPSLPSIYSISTRFRVGGFIFRMPIISDSSPLQLRYTFYVIHVNHIPDHIRSNKDEQNWEDKSAIALHAIKTGHTVAFENVQTVITIIENT